MGAHREPDERIGSDRQREVRPDVDLGRFAGCRRECSRCFQGHWDRAEGAQSDVSGNKDGPAHDVIEQQCEGYVRVPCQRLHEPFAHTGFVQRHSRKIAQRPQASPSEDLLSRLLRDVKQPSDGVSIRDRAVGEREVRFLDKAVSTHFQWQVL